MTKTQQTSNRELFSVVAEMLREGTPVRVIVRGQSMLPFFISGSTVTIRPIREDEFVRGNVVLGDTGRNFVVHRILNVTPTHVELLGDGNIYGTEKIPRELIYGIIDCSKVHLWLAGIWRRLRYYRRYPLAILRRITPR